MQIHFSIVATTLAKAADIEKFLKDGDINYDLKIDNAKSHQPLRRKHVSKVVLAVVVKSIQDHPDWHDGRIAKSTGVGSATVNRIRNNVHVLQTKGKK